MKKMPKPQTEAQFFLHQCDYLASRKNIIVKDIKYNPNDFIINEAATVIEQIISLCKEKIAGGADRNALVKLIADNNNGIADPRTIHTLAEAGKILKLIDDIKTVF